MEGKCENGRMRIAILHHELEWAEKQFQKEFVRRGQICHLFDVRNVNSTEELSEYDLVMNRVYPSLVADEGTYNDSIKTVRLLEELEGQGVRTFNSCKTTMADYSKFYSSSLMNEADVRNPATILVNDEYDIGRALKFSRKKGFPLIVKRDIGGRGKDVKKVNGGDALKDILGTMLSPKYRSSYNGGIVVSGISQK